MLHTGHVDEPEGSIENSRLLYPVSSVSVFYSPFLYESTALRGARNDHHPGALDLVFLTSTGVPVFLRTYLYPW